MPEIPINSPVWSQTTRWIVAILILIGAIWLFIVAFPLIQAVFIAALLGYLLDPLVRLLVRKLHLRRTIASAIVYLIVLLVLLSLPAALGAFAYGQFQNFGSNLSEAIQALQTWLSRPLYILGFRVLPESMVSDVGQAVGNILTIVPGGSFNILAGLTTNLLWGLVIVISLYYFLKDGPKIKPWLVSLFPSDYQLDATRLLNEIDDVWQVFLRVQLLIFVVLAVLFVLGSLLVVLMYQAGMIPYSWIGFIIVLIIVYALVQQVDNLWLRPQLLGPKLRLHPAVVFIGLIGALALSGLLGAIVIVPFIATGKVVGSYVRRKMLGLPAWPPDANLPASQPADDTSGQEDIIEDPDSR